MDKNVSKPEFQKIKLNWVLYFSVLMNLILGSGWLYYRISHATDGGLRYWLKTAVVGTLFLSAAAVVFVSGSKYHRKLDFLKNGNLVWIIMICLIGLATFL